VEVDVKLALGLFTISQAADYLAHYVPMDHKTAEEEAANFAVGRDRRSAIRSARSRSCDFWRTRG
jgi:hypothetical protein